MLGGANVSCLAVSVADVWQCGCQMFGGVGLRCLHSGQVGITADQVSNSTGLSSVICFYKFC